MITFDLSDLERSASRSLKFGRPISCKGGKIGHILLLNSNGKPYIWVSNGMITFDLSDLEMSGSNSLRF